MPHTTPPPHQHPQQGRSWTWLLVLLLWSTSASSSAPLAHAKPTSRPTLSASVHQRAWKRLQSLKGPWRGKATQTPVGVVSYNIHFRPKAATLYGMSPTSGVSQHHWTFFLHKGQLKLRFLTTFEGNTTPEFLSLQSAQKHRLTFSEPKRLTVQLDLQPKRTTITILLHHKFHVRIQLLRTKPPTKRSTP